ncbi:hypothetical protein EWM64_g5777 [Hericium alpestre]|uniref:Peptidase S1 domain-containing protein n=1 Tax=Hericium alpestre TaxID=135208 RepID=A0A4Y9ZTV3_9AGAM|nr:hypothetical protein EWM64_g5777 [Hericium alpestre]
MIRKHLERHIRLIEGQDNSAANMKRNQAQGEMQKAEKAMEELSEFHKYVSTQWATPESRLLGHVILSPPIGFGFGSEGYTHDWALVEIDTSKVNANNFDGNAIDLGTHISCKDSALSMNLHCTTPHPFRCPNDHLLRIKGTISDGEMRKPSGRDQTHEPCIMVIKRGITTGLAVGRANNILSFVRNPDYFDDDTDDNAKTSQEWAILPRNFKSGAFSEKGDSGSIIVDGRGRAGGLLTGGSAGLTLSTDITYAMPIDSLLKRMQELGVHSPCIL